MKKLIVELTMYKAAVCNAYMHFNGQEEDEDPVMDNYWKQEQDAEARLLDAIQADKTAAVVEARLEVARMYAAIGRDDITWGAGGVPKEVLEVFPEFKASTADIPRGKKQFMDFVV